MQDRGGDVYKTLQMALKLDRFLPIQLEDAPSVSGHDHPHQENSHVRPGDLAWDRDAFVTKQGPRQGGSGLGHAYTSRSEKLKQF